MKKTSLIGFLIIGNEILSGRTAEKNLPVLAKILQTRGLRIKESLIVRDSQKDIVAALNHLLSSCNYVFTSGGIGATHDDITTAAVAAYLKLAVEENLEMLALLSRFCKNRGLPITAVRRRMALAPKGAKAVLSNFPGAPGYAINNILVCAGVPSIFAIMATAAARIIPEEKPFFSQTLMVECPESDFAEALAAVQEFHNEVEIGSYPRNDGDIFYCHLVFDGTDKEKITAAKEKTEEWLKSNRINHTTI